MERVMQITVEERYAQAFHNVLEEDQISNPKVFLDVNDVDEVPVYSYLDQLDYLSSLPFAEANQILIRCTALFLQDIVSTARQHGATPGKTILRMVSVTGWLNENDDRVMNYDGTTNFLRPNIWLANLDHPNLSNFSVHPVSSPAGHFTKKTINADERFMVAEASPDRFGRPSPERTYIYMPGSEGTDRLTVVSD
jgi:hypothetical protein